MLEPFRLAAGFICAEGQAAANMKQAMYTFVAFMFVITLLAVTRASRLKKVWWSLIIILGGIAVLATLIVGPFFYSSWGCSNNVRDIILGPIQ